MSAASDCYVSDGRLTLVLAGRPLLSNDRKHWAAKAKLVAATRGDAMYLGLSQLNAWRTQLSQKVADAYTGVWPVRITARARIPLRGRPCDAAAIEPAVKAAVDGLCDAKILPGDDPRYVESITFAAPARSSAGWGIVLVIG